MPQASSGGLLGKLISFFTGGGDPETERKRLLRIIGKELSKSRFKFYRVKSDEALPGLAKFFYDIYKIVSGAQVLLAHAESSGSLRLYLIENFLSEDEIKLQYSLQEDAIREKATKLSIQELSKALKDDLVSFFSVFDAAKVAEIDSSYSTLIEFINFINFDYFFLLKKFDSNMSERNFVYHPKFEQIKSQYVSDDLKDFLEVLLALDLQADWKKILDSLKNYKGVDVILADAWFKFLGVLKDVRDSKVLEQIVRYVDKNPTWVPQVRRVKEHIIEPHLQKIKAQTEMCVQKLIQERRNSKIDELVRYVFGSQVIARTKNYAEKANMVFAKKTLAGYLHVQALNYLKAFLLDFFKKDIRELIDHVLIRGQWTTNILSQQLSESFHELMKLSDELLKFDDSVAEEGELGSKLKGAMLKAERNKEELRYVRIVLKDINDRAQAIINGSAQNLISVGKNLKSLIDDFDHSPHEIIINWKEVEASGGDGFRDKMVGTYKKIYFFVQLLQFFVKQGESEQG
jgi:hypothetical protein